MGAPTMTVGELKKAVEAYLEHGEEDDAVRLHLPPADFLTFDAHSEDLELDHEHYAFGLRPAG